MDSFKSLQDEISKALVSTTRSAAQIGTTDIPFERSLNPEIGTALDTQNARLLHLAQRLLENAAASSDAVGPKLPDADAIDGNWRGIVDVIDSLLEKADISLDEYTGVVKRLSPSSEQAAAVAPRPNIAEKKQISKPQLLFDHAPKNYENGGFRPLLTTKPHAKIPLEECLKTFKDKHDREQYPHPYQTEIETYEYPPSVYEHSEPQLYQPFESTTATFVDTPEALAMMLAELKTAKEIAVDIEHHDNRTYIGIVSLMQISTRDKDWIVDTLKPWRRRLECLNEVFADPSILKVLHGAFMDVIWLQRDLGLYLVGLFDTFHAARALGYPGGSLAYLLDRFVRFKAQKQYQLADWRTRPLGQELLEYARADTHFLLYIYDNMRNELVEKSNFSDPEKNKVLDVLRNSKEVALKRYEHPIYDMELGLGPVGWYKLITKTPVRFTPQQFSVFKAVHKWRDDVGRQEDESPLFVMPNHAVFSTARLMPVDKTALFNAAQQVSPILRARADDLISVIAKAKAAGVDGPQLEDVLKNISNMRDVDLGLIKAPKAPTVASAPKPVLERPPPVSILATPAPRAQISQFWGSLLSAVSPQQKRRSSLMNVDLALPLPPLTAEIFANGNGLAEESTPKAEKPQYISKEDRPDEDLRTDIFVVKQLGGRKRKHGEATDSQASAPATPALDPMQDDEIMLEEEDPEVVAARQAKAARKEARKQKKKEREGQASTLNEDEPAFDYANAPSVLHAKDAEAGKKKKDKKGKKKKDKEAGFNPLAKLNEAPKGLPRAQKEIAGRSRTFTS